MHYTKEMCYVTVTNDIKRRLIQVVHYCPICKKNVYVHPSVELISLRTHHDGH